METIDISDIVRGAREELIADLQELVSVTRDGHEALQDYAAEMLRRSGADVSVVDYRPQEVSVDYEIGAPTPITSTERYVVGSFGSGDDGLQFWAHSDSEPVDATGWTKPLFDGVIEAGRMYGWGIGDDLVGVGLMLAIAKLAKSHSLLGERRTLLASVPSKKRAQAIIHAMDAGFVGSGSVYLHPAESGVGLAEIKAMASGMLRFKLRVHGRPPETTEPGHTIFSHQAEDPVMHAIEVIGRLRALGDRRAARVQYAPIHDALGRSTNLHVPHIQVGSEAKLGKVPPFADVFFAITFPPTEKLADVQAEVVGELEELNSENGWFRENPLVPEWVVGIEGAAIPLDSKVYTLTEAAITAATGSKPVVYPLHAGSDIRNPWLYKGIPTVGIGPRVGGLTVSGGTDEWVDVEDYLLAVDTVCRLAHDYSR